MSLSSPALWLQDKTQKGNRLYFCMVLYDFTYIFTVGKKILIDNFISNNFCFLKYFSFTGCCFPTYAVFQRDIPNMGKKMLQGLANEMRSLTVQMFISMHASYKSKLMRTVMAQLRLS